MILVNKTWLKCAIMLTGRPTVPHLLPTVNPKSNPNSSSDLLTDKKLCYHRKTVWCTMSLKILSLTETSRTIQYNKSIYNAHMVSLRAESMARKICATNRMELEGYSWSTCSIQPRLVDCPIGVGNKLDHRRWVLLTTRSSCRREIF